MRRYLVVANQTLGGESLLEEIRRRIAGGPASFHVVVPERPQREFPLFAGDEGGVVMDTTAEARQHRATLTAQSRLQQLVAQIKAGGAQAGGEIGDSDPIVAIGNVLSQGEQYDEIIISTLPTGASRCFGWTSRTA
jgi:hypothetical protein